MWLLAKGTGPFRTVRTTSPKSLSANWVGAKGQCTGQRLSRETLELRVKSKGWEPRQRRPRRTALQPLQDLEVKS